MAINPPSYSNLHHLKRMILVLTNRMLLARRRTAHDSMLLWVVSKRPPASNYADKMLHHIMLILI